MKNLISLNFIIEVLVICCVLTVGCSDNDTNPPLQPSDPIITEIGIPTGQISSFSIGAEGGTVESADGKLTLIIPAGAFSSNTTVTIQPISNEGPLGLGAGYRLQPEGQTFAKPVTLQFHYDEQLLKGVPEDFLWIITQSDNGGWNAMLKSFVNPETKTVAVETTHFSDWSLGKFIDLTLSPASSTVLKNQSLQLNVTGFVRDETTGDDDELVPLIPITGDGDGLTPLTPIPPVESRFMNFRVKGWMLNGSDAPVSNSNGSLQGSKNIATYTAPNKKPSTNPVSVSVQLESNNKEGRKGSYILNSNISVMDADRYLLIKIDGQSYEYYQYGFDGILPSDPNNYAIANCSFSDNTLAIVGSMVVNDMDLSNLFGMEMKNPEKGSRSLSCFYSTGDDDMNFMPSTGIAYENERVTRTLVDDVCYSENTCSDISITLSTFENKNLGEVSGYFSGTLYEEKSGYPSQCKSSDAHTIEGEFKLLVLK